MMGSAQIRKTAFITGAASGIGYAIAQALARDGYALGLNDIAEERLDLCVQDARAAGAAVARPYRAGVEDAGAIAAAIGDFTERCGACGKLFANAGIGFVGVPFGEIAETDWDWLIRVNVEGVINVVSAALPAMIAAGSPAQVEITASLAALHAMAGWHIGPYAGSKSFVALLAQGIRDQVGSAPITVSTVYPGVIDTDINGNFRRLHGERGGHGNITTPGGLDTSQGMRADDAARIILAAMDAGVADVFTHPEHSQTLLDARVADLTAGIRASSTIIQDLGAVK